MNLLDEVCFEVDGESYRADMSRVWDLAIRLDFDGPQPNAFHLGEARAKAVEAGDFVGDTRLGGSANCADVHLNPHGNGTHTECVGHIVDEPVAVGELAKTPLMPAVVLSVPLVSFADSGESYGGKHADDDRVITRHALESAFAEIEAPAAFCQAAVLRTLPNSPDKTGRRYSGTNPPYPTSDAIAWLREMGCEHVVLDLPSLDREDDGGILPNHHQFFGVPQGEHSLAGAEPSTHTVTEMAFVSDEVADGIWLLDLQLPRFALDAAPSRPLLVEVIPS
ncbi:cyclase family protein [Persicimonas caeni]|uniref:Cyclase family protein n=1 Tax=Persicimonas caeni TaxID=2292766 RepID=A0A4Y6PR73_PERCE|nr:cyclase family protein [Persicimonas caeni]QDG50723.1 cyclase family protein [Persicimonas caeni]QED31944.1 cyclase family protein [Persicimonas caeni]